MSQQVNLFNPCFSRQRKSFSAQAMAQGLGIVLLCVVLFYVYAQYQVKKMEQLAMATAHRLNVEQSHLVGATAEFSPKTKSKKLEEEISQLEVQARNRQKILAILQSGELSNTAGFSAYFKSFSRQVIDGLWLTGFTIHGAGQQMTINGRATNPELVPAYIKRLNQEQPMQGKSFSAMEISLPAVKPDAAAPQDHSEDHPKDHPAKMARFVEFRLMSAEKEKESEFQLVTAENAMESRLLSAQQVEKK